MFLGTLRKRSVASLLSLVAVLLSGQQALAEEVTAEKTGLLSLFPTAYSKINLRNYNLMATDAKNPSPYVQARYYLGAKFFEEKLDTYLILGINKKYQSEEFSKEDRTFYQRNPQLFAEYSLFSGDLVSISPYAAVELPLYGSSLSADVGSLVVAQRSLAIPAGKLTVGGMADLWASQVIGRKETKVDIADEAKRERIQKAYSLTPTAEGDLNIREDYLRYGTYYGVWASYEPEMMDGLSLTLDITYKLKYSPVYRAVGAENSEVIKNTGTSSSGSVENTLAISYAITDELSVSNSLVYYVDGFYEQEKASGEISFMNMAEVSYSLF